MKEMIYVIDWYSFYYPDYQTRCQWVQLRGKRSTSTSDNNVFATQNCQIHPPFPRWAAFPPSHTSIWCFQSMKSAVGSINRSRDRLQVSSGVLLPTNVTDDLVLSGIYRLWPSGWILPTSFSSQPRPTCIPRRCKEKKSVDTSWEELSRRVKLMDGGGCRREIFSCLCPVGMCCATWLF